MVFGYDGMVCFVVGDCFFFFGVYYVVFFFKVIYDVIKCFVEVDGLNGGFIFVCCKKCCFID